MQNDPVEILARALFAAETYGSPDYIWEMMPAAYHHRVTEEASALLPLLVAAETERCAKVADAKAQELMDKQLARGARALVGYGLMLAGQYVVCKQVAAAIRAPGKGE